jgi:hypothetical protein
MVFNPFESFEFEVDGNKQQALSIGDISIIYDGESKLGLWDLLKTDEDGTLANKLGINDLCSILESEKLKVADLLTGEVAPSDLIDSEEPKLGIDDFLETDEDGTLANKLDVNDLCSTSDKIQVSTLLSGKITPSDLIDSSSATKVTLSEASINSLRFPDLTNTVFDLEGVG